MTQGEKPQHTNKPKRQEKGLTPRGEARAWATVNKVHGGSMKISAGRKLPSGPVGGNGRKTNLSRSS